MKTKVIVTFVFVKTPSTRIQVLLLKVRLVSKLTLKKLVSSRFFKKLLETNFFRNLGIQFPNFCKTINTY